MDDLVKQIVNQFLFLSAGSAALTKLKELLRKPEEIPSSLAESLPAQATFFICYIMLRSFTGFSLELLRVVDLIIIPIKRKWFCYTPREDEAAWRPPYVLYDRLVSIKRNLVPRAFSLACGRGAQVREKALGTWLYQALCRPVGSLSFSPFLSSLTHLPHFA